jgi:hypothetical protein
MKALLLLLLIVFLLSSTGAGDMIGDPVILSGRALGYDLVYLFVTGPDLVKSGVNPERMNSPVVTGSPQSFVVVETDGNGYWQYRWRTTRVGITLEEGLYTVYAATKPVSKQDLSGTAYDSTAVRLTYSRPATVSATPTYTGMVAVEVSTTPGAQDTSSRLPPPGGVPETTTATTRTPVHGSLAILAVASGVLLFSLKKMNR